MLSDRTKRLLATIPIVAVLVLQAVASSRAHAFHIGGFDGDPELYPFISYPMHARAHFADEPLERLQLVGVRADSTTLVLSHRSLDLPYWIWRKNLVRGIEDREADAARLLASIVREQKGEHLVAVHLEDHPLMLAPHGFTELEGRVLVSLSLGETAE